MNNPLPVDPFSVAEAARRTWPVLIEAMLEAVCLVEPEGLRIVAANGAAGRLLGLHPSELIGRDMLATAPTPEDESFWQRVADQGGCASILSDSYVTHSRGRAVPVVRRVSKIEPAPGNALYVVALVVAVNSARPLKPTVIVHDAATPRAEALVFDLEKAGGIGIRRSMRAQQLPPPALDYLAPTARVTYFFEPSAANDEE